MSLPAFSNEFLSIDFVLESWQADAKIDKTNIAEEAINTPQIHSKYLKFWMGAKKLLQRQERALRTIRLAKTGFYTQGPTREQHERGWRLPPQGKVLKSDASAFVEADPDVENIKELVADAKDLVECLDKILKMISDRSFYISTAAKVERFQAGVD